MPRPAATDEERAEQRRRIRVAAAELHDEGGMAAVSVRAVAKRAGVSTGLLYSYFANLSELMQSLWMGPIAQLGERLAQIESAEPDPVARIERLLTCFIDFTLEHPEVHRGLLLYVRPLDAPNARAFDPDTLLLHASLRRAVEQGQRDDRLRAGDAAEHAQLLWSGVHGALALPVNSGTFALRPGPEIAHTMVRTLLTAMTIEAEASP